MYAMNKMEVFQNIHLHQVFIPILHVITLVLFQFLIQWRTMPLGLKIVLLGQIF